MPEPTTVKKSAFNFVSYLLPVVGALCLLAGTIWAVYQAGFTPPMYILMGVGLFLFMTIFIRAEWANMQYYLHVSFYSLLVGGICVVLYLFARTYTAQIDLTKQHLHSLSDASVKYMKNLDQPVTISIFISSSVQDKFLPIQNLYNSYTKQLTWKFDDPIKNPAAAQQMGERVVAGDIFFASGQNKKKISVSDLDPQFVQMPAIAENTFTNAIITVTRKNKPHVYFLVGHGEIPFTAQRPAARNQPAAPSVAGLCKALNERGIATQELDLARAGKIPDDASIVVIDGPQRDLFDPEVNALKGFLDSGGKLLALLDILTPDGRSLSLTSLRKLLSDYGVDTPESLVLDQFSAILGVDPPVFPMIGPMDPRHPITRDLVALLGNARSFVQGPTRPLLKGTLPPEMSYVDLIKSSPESYSVPLAKLKDNITPPPKNEQGSVTFGVAVEKRSPPPDPGAPPADKSKGDMRIAVYGSSLFGRDDFLAGNDIARSILFNTVDWLAQSEEMIAIPARRAEETPIVLDLQKQRVILVIAVILLPAALFFGGVSYSVMRRRR